jgi:hypothetical protein
MAISSVAHRRSVARSSRTSALACTSARVPQPRVLPERFVAGGDTVGRLGRIELRWIESGEVAHEGESAGAYWFRDGKIITWQPFETHAAALKETGLGE